MRRGTLSFLIFLATFAVAHAARFEVAPYLQDARPGGITVLFETDVATEATVVVTMPSGEQRFSSPTGTHHEVRIEGLSAGRHPYRVVAGNATSAPSELAPAATGGDFTFLVYGDNRDRDADHARVIEAMRREPADLLVQTGDMTGDGGDEALWRRFFAIEAPLLATTPMFPALGNHELLHDPGATHYHRYFALPSSDVAAEDAERYYAFHYGNALFIALDGNDSHQRSQAEWLARTLDGAARDPAVRHVFVFFHQPSFSVGEFCGSAAEQGLWVPLFERARVRAVFTGHEHAYERLERNGVRYFVAGGGGAPLRPMRGGCPLYDQEALKVFRSTFHFLRVRVRGDEATLDAIGVDGEVFDSARLHEPSTAGSATAVPYRDRPIGSPMRGESLPLPAWLMVAMAGLGVGLATLVAAAVRRR